MAARPRIRKRANWPDNLHEPRPGYYVWRDPRDGKTHVLGRVALAQAIHEAIEANVVVSQSMSRQTLTDRLKGARTVSDLIKRMPRDELKAATRRSYNSHNNAILAKFGDRDCVSIKTDELSDFLDAIKEKGTLRMAQAIRTRLIDVFARGVSIGWVPANPAAVTLSIQANVKRQRLTLETFKMILAKAPEVADWFPNAMLLALVSGQDRSTIGAWERGWTKDGTATVYRQKTDKWIAIPTALRMDAIGLSLADVIAQCKSSSVVSKFLIHHPRSVGAAKRGDPIRLQTITDCFTEARRLAELPDKHGVSFHEIRSLSKRLYDEQGSVDTKALLGHSTDATAAIYANNRGIEPIKVKIGA